MRENGQFTGYWKTGTRCYKRVDGFTIRIALHEYNTALATYRSICLKEDNSGMDVLEKIATDIIARFDEEYDLTYKYVYQDGHFRMVNFVTNEIILSNRSWLVYKDLLNAYIKGYNAGYYG